MDPNLKQTIDDLELLMNAPKRLADMLPHERILADAIGRTAIELHLTDIDVLQALPRICAFYLRSAIERYGVS